MNVLLTGASGLIGKALKIFLIRQGHQVFVMKRDEYGTSFNWSFSSGRWRIHWDEHQPIDAVFHLAGETISGRWTTKKKQRIVESRMGTTKALVEQFSNMKQPPSVFLSASAIGYYGHCGSKQVDESHPAGDDFLAQLAVDWENAASSASELGIRVVNLRTGLVLSQSGGALNAMLKPFKLGLGGKIGTGDQWMSWVSLDEVVRMMVYLLNNQVAAGPFNLVSPHALSNADFTYCLAQSLNRPAFVNMPAFIVRKTFGEMGELLLLGSTRVKPSRLIELGYDFDQSDLSATLARMSL